LARLSVPATDPRLANWSEAEWYYHFIILHREDRRRSDYVLALYKAGGNYLREMLISVLGLRPPKLADTPDVNGEGPQSDGDGQVAVDTNDDSKAIQAPQNSVEPYVPFVYLVGRPEQVKAFMEAADDDVKIEKSFMDSSFDEISKRLASDVGDMDPILEGLDLSNTKINEMLQEEQMENMRKALGIIVGPVRQNVDAVINLKKPEPLSEIEQAFLKDLLPELDTIK
jgi:hypothetical protein